MKTRKRKAIHMQKTAGCLEVREQAWCERLRQDMQRAEAYFWAQTPERREIQRRYLNAMHRFAADVFLLGRAAL